MLPLNLGDLNAVVCALAGLAAIWLMQKTTYAAGVSSLHAVLRLFLRLGLAALSLALFYAATDAEDGGWPMLAVNGVLLFVLLVSGFAHKRSIPAF